MEKTKKGNKIVIYTYIGAFLVVLGVYTSTPEESLASGVTKNFSNIATLELPLTEDLTKGLSLEEKTVEVFTDIIEDRSARRVEIILQAIEEGKFTQEEAEILNYMEDLVPLNSEIKIYPELNRVFNISVGQFTSLIAKLKTLGIDEKMYM